MSLPYISQSTSTAATC